MYEVVYSASHSEQSIGLHSKESSQGQSKGSPIGYHLPMLYLNSVWSGEMIMFPCKTITSSKAKRQILQRQYEGLNTNNTHRDFCVHTHKTLVKTQILACCIWWTNKSQHCQCVSIYLGFILDSNVDHFLNMQKDQQNNSGDATEHMGQFQLFDTCCHTTCWLYKGM